MIFNLSGQFNGLLCNDLPIPIPRGTVRVYAVQPSPQVHNEMAAEIKDTLHLMKEEELQDESLQFLGEGKLDGEGKYSVKWNGEEKQYEFGPFRVVLDLPSLGPIELIPDDCEPQTVGVTTCQPKWQTSDEKVFRTEFSYAFPSSFFCRLLELYDLWVISGRVLNCDTRRPLQGVKVTAMDCDVITDDVLGSDTTNAQGQFIIWYRERDFKRTFLSPWINVETPFGRPIGPDVYFKLESLDGRVLLEEEPKRGKEKDRKDRGHCFCLDLCVDFEEPNDPDALAWTSVGIFNLTTEGNPQNFSADGYAAPSVGDTPPNFSNPNTVHYAVWNRVVLEGQGPNPLDTALDFEYRFLIGNQTAPNTAPYLPENAFTASLRPVGGAGHQNLFHAVEVGELVRTSGTLRVIPVRLTLSEVDAAGWVDIRAAVVRTVNAHPVFSMADINDPAQGWSWKDTDAMIGLDTRPLTSEVTPTLANAGDEIPLADRNSVERTSIRFEIREKGTGNPLPANGTTLNSMVVSNTNPVAKIDARDAAGNVKTCDKFKNEDVFLGYTVYHAHLHTAGINVRSNSGAFNHSQTNAPIAIDTNAPGGPVYAQDNSFRISPQPNFTCTYRARLSFSVRQHNGVSPRDGSHTDDLFFYET